MSASSSTDNRRVLDIVDLSVTFGQGPGMFQAVKALNLHVDRGETIAIVGESGSGKSVTSLSIMRLIEFGGGRIAHGGMTFYRPGGPAFDLVSATDEEMRKVRGAHMGMIFQEPMTSLNPVFTVGAQIVEAILLHQDCDTKAAMAAAQRVLDQVRIPDSSAIMRRYPHELSGGMRQRVMIAMALSCKPALLIADEPTTALDVTIQAQILQLIRELQRDMDMGVIFITHDMGVVAEVADRVLVMRRGEVVEENNVNDLFGDPKHAYTQALLAAVPKLGAMRGTTLPARFDLLSQPDAAVDIRPTKDLTPQSRACTNAPPSANVILSVRNLVTRFDVREGFFSRVKKRVHAVDNVSFDLHAGETLSLVGESGCGKTTTGRSLLRLTQVTGGAIEFDGKPVQYDDPHSLRTLRRNIQFIFQDPFASLNPRMRVGDCVKEPMLIHGLGSGAQADRRVAELFERVGLEAAMMKRWPHEFSGGQRQRICIARALSVEPKILIADESVSALDVSIQAQVINLLIDLQQDMGVAYLFISHDMAIVERVSHRVAVMYLGQIVEIGPRQAIFENPQHPYTKKLMQAVPIADPALRRTTALEVNDLPSPIRRVGDEPHIPALVEVGSGHFVAQHRVGGSY